MTALVIFLAAWRQRRACMGKPVPQPSPCDIALEHIVWMRRDDPHLSPAEAGAMIGAVTPTWAAAVLAFAAAWENLQNL
jgi:hypothetical protein